MRVLDPGSGSLNYAVLIPPCQAMTPGLHGQGNAPTQTRLQGQEIVMYFAFEIWKESNPRRSKTRSRKVFDFNHSVNRVYTIGTECSHHMCDGNIRHVMRTFGTNRIYTVDRVVKVEDLTRSGFAPAWVRFPLYLECKIHHVVSSFVCMDLTFEWTITHSFLFLYSIFFCMYSFDNFSVSLIDSSLQHAFDPFRVLCPCQFLEGDTESW